MIIKDFLNVFKLNLEKHLKYSYKKYNKKKNIEIVSLIFQYIMYYIMFHIISNFKRF